MPKSGLRPYECVRKAWHSDRHQPVRGSLIQEIFRIVNEVHGLATKKNKEWQEKLPIVVFRAEEIMYSKAHSEAEYVDLKTLWVRLNDAIDTIIRRDDNMESKSRDLLLPCIEAALHLVSSKRSSRSQKNNCPKYYLTPQSNSFPTSCSAYPLYHGCQFEFSGPKFGSTKSNAQLVDDNNKKISLRNTVSCNINASSETSQTDCEDVSENQTATGCDLSLRLGTCNRVQNAVLYENGKVGDICKLTDLSPQFNKGLSFFFKENADTKHRAKRKQGEDQQIYWPVKLPFNKFRS